MAALAEPSITLGKSESEESENAADVRNFFSPLHVRSIVCWPWDALGNHSGGLPLALEDEVTLAGLVTQRDECL